ncbi:MAG: hypothetical protein E7527_06095 [Ruminococcaceae bacterium]|nr:hypothetical protein [Oscillospiraceae bacterium]
MKRTLLRVLSLLCVLLLMGATVLTGCGGEAPAAETDPHADHNHSADAPEPTDTPAAEAHDHKGPAAMRLNYETAQDGTLTLIIKDCKGNVVGKETGLKSKALSTQITDSVSELYWVTDKNDNNGYKSLYINRLTCQVTEMIHGAQASDGNRIVYSEVKDGKLMVTVRDLFNKNGYVKVTEIKEAYTAGGNPVQGTVLIDKSKGQVNVSYLTDKDGGRMVKVFSLYESNEENPHATKPTNKK